MATTPTAWSMKRLKDITSKIGSGATPRGGKNGYRAEGISLIRSLNVYDFSFTEEDLAFIGDEQATELDNVIVQKDDILLNITGASVARCCLTNPKFLPARVNQHVAIVRVRPEVADARFVLYCINSLHFKSRLLALAQGGATREALTKTTIENFEVCQPPLPVQRRIAGILSAYDELMENSQRRIRICEAMARTLYREWFVHFRFPGHKRLPRVASFLGDIPRDWEVKPLESLMADHIGGGWGKEAADEDHIEPAWVIRGTDIPDARSSQVADVPHRFHSVSNLRNRRLQAGDILFEVSGGSKGQPVGRTLLVTPQLLSAFGDDAVICASFCKRIRPDAAGYGSELLYLSFLEGYESGEIEQFQVQSTGISNFKWTEYIAKTKRVIPPERLRVLFRDRVVPLFSQIAALGLQIQNLHRTRDLLLPQLLSGNVTLKLEDAHEKL